MISALRACYLQRPVVLFDEISSSLDSSLEQALRQLVLTIQKQSLTIVVAHRIETLLNADKIIVMDKGLQVAMEITGNCSRTARFTETLSAIRQRCFPKSAFES